MQLCVVRSPFHHLASPCHSVQGWSPIPKRLRHSPRGGVADITFDGVAVGDGVGDGVGVTAAVAAAREAMPGSQNDMELRRTDPAG